MRPDSIPQQADGRRHLPHDLDLGTNLQHVIPQSKRHNDQGAQDDSEVHFGMNCGPAGIDAMQREILAHGHARQPAEEDRQASEVGHRLRVQLAHSVGLVDDVEVDRDRPHDRREDQRDDKGRIEHVHVVR